MNQKTASPAWVERTPSYINGRSTDRLIFIFRARGCCWAREPHKGCTNCGFHTLTTRGAVISDDDLLAQFLSVADLPDAFDGVGQVDLYNSGSFFADDEIPPRVRSVVLARLSQSPVERVLVESRPEFLTPQSLALAKAAIGNKQLEVGIGLESQNDYVRETLIHKGFGKREFEAAVKELGSVGFRLLSYVLLKPIGLSEHDAIEDVVATAKYVFDIAAHHGVAAKVALQPTFVPPDTKIDELFQSGQYLPPSLWSVVEAVQRIHPLGEISVGLSDEGLEPRRLASGCEKCTETLRLALSRYNQTRDLRELISLDCSCRIRTT